jgi:hypothetical protein
MAGFGADLPLRLSTNAEDCPLRTFVGERVTAELGGERPDCFRPARDEIRHSSKSAISPSKSGQTPDFCISYAIDCFGLGWLLRCLLSRQRGCSSPETAGGSKVTAV